MADFTIDNTREGYISGLFPGVSVTDPVKFSFSDNGKLVNIFVEPLVVDQTGTTLIIPAGIFKGIQDYNVSLSYNGLTEDKVISVTSVASSTGEGSTSSCGCKGSSGSCNKCSNQVIPSGETCVQTKAKVLRLEAIINTYTERFCHIDSDLEDLRSRFTAEITLLLGNDAGFEEAIRLLDKRVADLDWVPAEVRKLLENNQRHEKFIQSLLDTREDLTYRVVQNELAIGKLQSEDVLLHTEIDANATEIKGNKKRLIEVEREICDVEGKVKDLKVKVQSDEELFEVKFEKLEDSFDFLKQSTENQIKDVERFRNAARTLEDLEKEFRKIQPKLATVDAFEGSISALSNSVGNLKSLESAYNSLNERIQLSDNANDLEISQLANDIREFDGVVKSVKEKYLQFQMDKQNFEIKFNTLDKVQDSVAKLVQTIGDNVDEINRIKELARQLKEDYRRTQEDNQGILQNLSEFRERLNRFQKELDDFNDILCQLQQRVKELFDLLAKLTERVIDIETYINDLKAAGLTGDAWKALKTKVDGNTTNINKLLNMLDNPLYKYEFTTKETNPADGEFIALAVPDIFTDDTLFDFDVTYHFEGAKYVGGAYTGNIVSGPQTENFGIMNLKEIKNGFGSPKLVFDRTVGWSWFEVDWRGGFIFGGTTTSGKAAFFGGSDNGSGATPLNATAWTNLYKPYASGGQGVKIIIDKIVVTAVVAKLK